jgi:hypothetical protein
VSKITNCVFQMTLWLGGRGHMLHPTRTTTAPG